MLNKAISLDSSNAQYHCDFAEVLCNNANPKGGLIAIEHALKINPNVSHFHYIAGTALAALGNSKKAITAYNKAIELNPNNGLAYNNLGSIMENSGLQERAKHAYANAVKINANHPEAQNNLAAILLAEGDVENAKIHFEAAIKARPLFVEPHYNLSTIKNYEEDDAHITQLEAIARNSAALPADKRVKLCFALGKAYEDIGNYDAAFDLFEKGNTAHRRTFKFNEKRAIGITEQLKTIFNKEYFKGSRKKKSDDPTPIFVVGMPRSGSTLIEQILCSHDNVFGAGELDTMSKVINEKLDIFPNDYEKLSDDDIKEIGENYIRRIRLLEPDAKRIVDKMPANFHYAGIIAKALPGAHIINTERNPMDSCLSNYGRLFNQTMHFAYNLEELGRYYNRYQDLIKHWHSVLPKNRLIDVHYEKVVDDLENQAKRIIKFVGLEWDDKCLEFHKNKRTVHTASVAQVRKPIYKSSVERWKNFGDHLKPLKDIVAPE
nr:tetratricopeptide repeat-containing sulfotransferase family protein [Pseudemcibacter aquimaris]